MGARDTDARTLCGVPLAIMLKYFYDGANGLGSYIAPTKDNIDFDTKNKLLYAAAFENNKMEVYSLIFHGASPAALNEFGNAAVHVAASEGHYNIVQLFLEAERGCVNLRGRGGNSPLHFAASARTLTLEHFRTVECLLSHGANGLLKNDKCRSPFDVCSEKGAFAKKIKERLDQCLYSCLGTMLGNLSMAACSTNVGVEAQIQLSSSHSGMKHGDTVEDDLPDRTDQKIVKSPKMSSSSFDSILDDGFNFPLPDLDSPNFSTQVTSRPAPSSSKSEDAIAAFLNSKHIASKSSNNVPSRDKEEKESKAVTDGTETERVSQIVDVGISSIDIEDESNENPGDNAQRMQTDKTKGYFIELDGKKVWVSDGESDDEDADFHAEEWDTVGLTESMSHVVTPGASNTRAFVNDLVEQSSKLIEMFVSDDEEEEGGTDPAKILTPPLKKHSRELISSLVRQSSRISDVVVSATRETLASYQSIAQQHTVLDIHVTVDEKRGFGVQFDQFLRVVAFRPGNKPTPLENEGIRVGDIMESVNGTEVKPPLHSALATLKAASEYAIETADSFLVKLPMRFIRIGTNTS